MQHILLDGTELRTCNYCKKQKPIECFKGKNGNILRLCNHCLKSKSEYRKRNPHYSVDANARFIKVRRERTRDLIAALGGECQRCGYKSCYEAIDFHHVRRDTKVTEVSNALSRGDAELAKTEADKCILLCANCHREFENGYWHGDFIKRDGLGWTLSK